MTEHELLTEEERAAFAAEAEADQAAAVAMRAEVANRPARRTLAEQRAAMLEAALECELAGKKTALVIRGLAEQLEVSGAEGAGWLSALQREQLILRARAELADLERFLRSVSVV